MKADFAPLVSEATFDRVQKVLQGRAPAPKQHVRERQEFPLRGLLLCPECGKAVTASKSKGKGGTRFPYYRCHRVNGHMNVRAEVVESAFVDLLNRLTPDQKRLNLIERIFRGQWNKRIQAATAESVKYRRELATEQARKQRILDQLADGVLSAEEFGGLNSRTTDRIADLKERLVLAESRELDLDTMVEFLIHKVWNTSIEWQMANISGKSSLQRRMFPEGLMWRETGFGTPLMHPLYSLLGTDWMSDSELVAPQGFEPRSSESESLVLPLNEGAPGKEHLAGVANAVHSLTDY